MKRIPKIAILALFIAAFSCYTTSANAQDKKAAPKENAKKPVAPKATGKGSDGFKKLPSGLEYKIVTHGTGTRKPAFGDHIEMYIHVHVEDSVMFDSRKMYNNKPVPFPITKPKFKGDPIEGFMMMVVGDSAIFRLPVDSMKKAGNQLLPWMKEGMKIEYNVVLTSVRSDEEDKKFNAEAAAKQMAIDDKLLQEYFTANNIKPLKTASGLYYTITAEGTGDQVKAGNKVSVNYTGKFLDGKKFDSNMDSAFHHMQSFDLEVGKGKVIKGWDEGLQLLKKGSKATFYVPSGLAYGSMERAPIPANAILVFDIELTDVETPQSQDEKAAKQAAIDDKLLQDYFAKNNITATKTQSGLYYVITQKGLGPTAKAGKKVTMNYVGKTLDGTAFDSNTDPKFNHVAPFPFNLGMGQVIKGWDEGIQLLQLGSKATLYIPSGLAYGAQGAGGGAIPPNAVLVFDVEVLGIDK